MSDGGEIKTTTTSSSPPPASVSVSALVLEQEAPPPSVAPPTKFSLQINEGIYSLFTRRRFSNRIWSKLKIFRTKVSLVLTLFFWFFLSTSAQVIKIWVGILALYPASAVFFRHRASRGQHSAASQLSSCGEFLSSTHHR